jgi:hypothetical protein
MHLSDFISENMESIIQAWEDFARTIELRRSFHLRSSLDRRSKRPLNVNWQRQSLSRQTQTDFQSL